MHFCVKLSTSVGNFVQSSNMYDLKNYLLSMQSHWMINQPLYKAVQQSIPLISKYRNSEGLERLPETPAARMCKQVFPEIYRVPIFRRQFCKMLVEEIGHMVREIPFTPNDAEDELRQIPEIVLREHCPQLYRNMYFVVQTIINPIIISLFQRECKDIASVQIANYNLREKKQGAWHHDESADMSLVVPLNTGSYQGGGTEFHRHGVLKPLPNGHGLLFPSFTNLHRGLAVGKGDRYLLVFWLFNKQRTIDLFQDMVNQ